ncbi:MAG: histidine phosphatase family protein [Clostridia bacterium]|nr:histidine phosphatase family protein [Clostridia bacterium]
MKIVFIRHGEPDFSEVDSRGFIGQGRDFAPLTKNGINQAEKVSKNPLLNNAQIIISSPYTRALQTAAIISKNLIIELAVETDLHEQIFDKTFRVKGADEAKALNLDFIKYSGEAPDGQIKKWETLSEITNRIKPVADKYYDLGFEKIIVVSHGGIIRRFTGKWKIDYCDVTEIEYNKNFSFFGWI